MYGSPSIKYIVSHDELMGIMNGGLRDITMKGNERRQPWFTHESAKLRKEFHRAEKEWLGCRDNELRKRKRSAYLEKRRVYKRAIGRTKMRYVEHKCSELEDIVRNPKKWWSIVKKLKMAGRRGDQTDTTKVSDKEGMTKVGKEAVEVWRRHFEEVLNEGQDSGEQHEPERVEIGND